MKIEGERGKLTSCRARAHRPIRRVLSITTNISHARIVQALALKVLAVEVLNAPEAAGCDGGLFGALGDGNGG